MKERRVTNVLYFLGIKILKWNICLLFIMYLFVSLSFIISFICTILREIKSDFSWSVHNWFFYYCALLMKIQSTSAPRFKLNEFSLLILYPWSSSCVVLKFKFWFILHRLSSCHKLRKKFSTRCPIPGSHQISKVFRSNEIFHGKSELLNYLQNNSVNTPNRELNLENFLCSFFFTSSP